MMCCMSIHSMGQQHSVHSQLAAFVENINTFNHLYPQEKVYLHFDNTGYFLGETIWFKAYVVVAENHLPTVLSRVLYVELLSPEGSMVAQKKLKVEDGQCHGDFFLKPEQYAGFYEIRAYTRVMLNFGEETIFSRVFPVFDVPKKEGQYDQLKMSLRPNSQKLPETRAKDEKRNNVNIHFFPEGGELVNGLVSNVAFKATDKQGKSISLSGTVYNAQKETIASFASAHNGMGSFAISPEEGKNTVEVEYEGKKYNFNLPASRPNGYVMKVNNMRNDFVFIEIQKSQGQTVEPLGISISCRGKINTFETVTTDEENSCTIKIPKSNLPSGVNQITLFNAKGEIFAERLFFINHQEQITLTAKQSNSVYSPFAKIRLEFQSNPPVEASFSLAVTDASASPLITTGSILTNLLLSSDLKGYIEDIDYYFESNDNQHKMALDLLMMTQGWRRYVWKQMAGVEPFELKHHIEKGIVIDGQVLSLFRKKKKENIEVTMWMYSEDGFSQQGKCMTDDEGRFNFLPDDFEGVWKLTLQTKEKGERKEQQILLDRHFSPQTRPYSYSETIMKKQSEYLDTDRVTENLIQENESDSLDSYKNLHGRLLPNVTVKGKKPFKKQDEGLAVANIVYDVASEIDQLKDKGEGYAENIPVFLLNTNRYFSERINNKTELKELWYKNKPVLYIVNNVEICRSVWRNEYNDKYTWGDISNILLSDVEKIIISEELSRYCVYTSSGNISCPSCENLDPRTLLIFIYTKDGNQVSEPLGIRRTRLQGYSQVKEFYSPDYSKGVLPNETDYRRTLYWNPNVKTDEQGKAQVTFYNNGSCRKINICAEGLTIDGKTVATAKE